jgi:hypothetical protein
MRRRMRRMKRKKMMLGRCFMDLGLGLFTGW